MIVINKQGGGQMTSGASRQILSRVHRGGLDRASAEDAEAADAYIDDALDMLRNGEPSALDWLENDPEVQRALKWNVKTIQRLLVMDAVNNRPITRTMEKVDRLVFRLISAMVLRAMVADRDRPRLPDVFLGLGSLDD